MDRAPDLAVKELVVRYSDSSGSVIALELEALNLQPGAQLVVTGPSGSGKSTLLYALAGLLRPASGSIAWGGRNILAQSEWARDDWRRHTIGFAFQDFQLMPELTPLQNVLLPATFESLRISAKLRSRASELLERFGVPHARRSTSTMSRGEQQRVAIARALLFDPPVILADEPTASLDAVSGALVADTLVALSRTEGRTLLAVSHDPALVERFTNRVQLSHGHRVEKTPEERAA